MSQRERQAVQAERSRGRGLGLAVAGFAVFALSVAACGGPKAGEPCSGAGYRCEDAQHALECRGSRWESLPCRGASGCSSEEGTVHCDLRGNLENDPCPHAAEGLALCGREGRSLIECQEGTFVMTLSCLSCSEADGGVRCVQ